MSASSTRVRRASVPLAGILDRSRIIAGPGYNRWLVPPAALAIHLCIGMAYGFSVFWLPLSQAHRHRQAAGLPGRIRHPERPVHDELRLARQRSELVFTLFIVVLGSPPPSGAAGWSGPGRARRAWSPRSAGAAAF